MELLKELQSYLDIEGYGASSKLARKVGMSTSSLARKISGERSIRPKEAIKLLQAIGVSPEKIKEYLAETLGDMSPELESMGLKHRDLDDMNSYRSPLYIDDNTNRTIPRTPLTEKLLELVSAKEKGLISVDEYETLRQKIINKSLGL